MSVRVPPFSSTLTYEGNNSYTQELDHERVLLKEITIHGKTIQIFFHPEEGVTGKVITAHTVTFVPSYDIRGIPQEHRYNQASLLTILKQVHINLNPLRQGDKQLFAIHVIPSLLGGGVRMSKVRELYKGAQQQEPFPAAAIDACKVLIAKILEIKHKYEGEDLQELNKMLMNSYFMLAEAEQKIESLEDALGHFLDAHRMGHKLGKTKAAEVGDAIKAKTAKAQPVHAPGPIQGNAAAAAASPIEAGSLGTILTHRKTRALEDDSVQELCKLYTPLKCVSNVNEMNVEAKGADLYAKFTDFMESPKKVFVLLGWAGGGKSSFTKYLEREFWEKCNPLANDATLVPVRIELGTLNNPLQNAVTEHLSCQGYTEQQIQELKHNRKVLLILDGYDEAKNPGDGKAITENLFVHNRLSDWKGKVVISGRLKATNVLDPELPDHLDKFAPLDEAVRKDLVEEVIITPFFPSQIGEYIRKFVQHASQDLKTDYPAWFSNTDLFTQTIGQRPDLQTLVRTPFVLRSVVESLPKIMTADRDAQMTKAMIYGHFTNGCFEREKVKWLKGPKPRPADLVDCDLGKAATAFCRLIARKMSKENQIVITYVAEDQGMQQKWGTFFGDSEQSQYLRSICSDVLRKTIVIDQGRPRNQYSFVHAELRDYFFTLS